MNKDQEHTRRPVEDIYPILITQFPGLNEQVEEYYRFVEQLQDERGSAVVDLKTDAKNVSAYFDRFLSAI